MHQLIHNRRVSHLAVVLAYLLFGVLWITGTDQLLEWFVDDPAVRAQIELSKGLGYIVITGIMLYVLLVRTDNHRQDSQDTDSTLPRLPTAKRLILGLGSIFILVPLIGLLIVRLEAPRLEQEAHRNLDSIAQLKAGQVEAWLDERSSDGRSLIYDPDFIRLISDVMTHGNTASLAMLRQRLTAFRVAYDYQSISLLSGAVEPHHVLLAGEPEHPLNHFMPAGPVQPNVSAGSKTAPAADAGRLYGQPQLYLYEGGIHLHLSFPLRVPIHDHDTWLNLLFMVRPDKFLNPYIDGWPVAASSGEALLATRAGDDMFFLTPMRREIAQSERELHMIDDPDLPAAVALRLGGNGIHDGLDYRGVQVLTAYRPVGGTDWQLVAKVDRSEVMQPLYHLVYWASIITLIAAALVAFLLIWLWLQQHNLHLLHIQAERHRADELLRQFYDLPFVGIAITSPQTKRWLRCNDRLCEILGYPREELLEKNWEELTHPDDLAADIKQFERVLRHEIDGYQLDKRFVRKDGSVVDTYIDVKCVRTPEGDVDHFVAMIQDISERKRIMDRIARLSSLYATLSHTNKAIVHSNNEDELFESTCRNAVDSGHFKMAWIGLVDTDSQSVVRKAAYGEGSEYTRDIRISLDPADPTSHGPTGTAVHEGHPYWCQDFLHDNATRRWHEKAKQFGFAASAALPLKRNNKVVGTFNLYSGEVNGFDEDAQNLLLEMASDISFALGNFELEKQHKEASERLALVIKGSNDAPWDWDLEQNRFWYSPQWRDLLGYKDNELSAEPGFWRQLVHPADLPAVDETLARIMHPGKEWESTECRFRHKDGNYIPTLVRSFASRNDDDRAIRLSGTIMDLRPIKESEDRLRQSLIGTITAISNTIEKRDPYTAGHQNRVAELSTAIAREMGLDARRIEGIYLGSLIHDIGKIYIPSEILNRPGRLSKSEFELIKSHPDVGFEIIKDVRFDWPIAEMVRQHHERIDGSGYPLGLKAEEICMEARIIATADIVEAMTAHRPYRPGLGIDVALAQIEKEAGTTLDRDIVDTCLKLFRVLDFEWPDSLLKHM
jgi:PAS domain S-box-containing protein/putative nucleotidyltransferase with HDIG domain